MQDNNSTNQSVGGYYVQLKKNCSYHRVIDRSPYKGLFGSDPKIGPSSTNLPTSIIKTLETENDLNEVLFNLQPEAETDNNSEPNNKLIIGHQNFDLLENEQPNIENSEKGHAETEPETIETNSLIKEVQEVTQQSICLDCTNQQNSSCVLCSKTKSILLNRNECHLGQKKAAAKMLTNTANKLSLLKIGDCVQLPVDKVDQGPSDMLNLNCVILEYKNGVYQLESFAGIIKGWYNHADIVATDTKFLNIRNGPNETISVREAVSATLLRAGQSFLMCACKPSKNNVKQMAVCV